MTLDTPLLEEDSVENASTSAGLLYKLGLVAVASCIIWASTLVMNPGPVDDETRADSVEENAFVNSDIQANNTQRQVLGDPLVVSGTLVTDTKTVTLAEADAITLGDIRSASSADQTTTTQMPDAQTAETQATNAQTTPTDNQSTNAAASTSSSDASGAAKAPSAAPKSSPSAIAGSGNAATNLKMILGASVRNKNHDASPHINTPSAQLNVSDHYGPRSDYLASPAQNAERAFPISNGGQFRAGCEFSHFTYDDPLVFPNQPGASHLHMHFGNTHVNAFSTFDSLLNSGSSTCNGQELNRTGYWVPALFDGNGNVRIPERVVVYYKGEGLARGKSEAYPDGAALIAGKNLNTVPESQGGVGGTGKMTFVCSDNYSTNTGVGSQTMPSCDGSMFNSGNRRTVLEMNVKFPQCWNGKNAADYNNFKTPGGSWYGSNCTGEFNRTLPNLEYFVNYKVDPGENTSNWFLSSDVDATAFGSNKKTGGSTLHADWWGGWHKEVANMWIKNCVNYKSGAPSGCGFGYLTDGGPNSGAPAPGPALKMRPQYTGPNKVPAATLFSELCPNSGRNFTRAEDAAYCTPK